MAKKKYDDGGEVRDELEAANASEEAQQIAGEAILKGMRDRAASEPSNFKEAFAAARKAGDKTFEFGGKKYNTEMAPARRAAPAAEPPPPAPPAKPARKQETMQDRAERYLEKRAKQRSEDASAREAAKSGIITTRPKASEQKFMGSMSFAKGGSVSSASRRADGIAQRGKTRGRIL